MRMAPDRAALELAFRRRLVRRAAEYLTSGDERVAPYVDRKTPVHPAEMFVSVLQRFQCLPRNLPCLADYLRAYPASPDQHVQNSFLYWSKETLGMKPTITITHFSVAHFSAARMPNAVVVAKQMYATHYKNASITATALASDGDSRYLVYVNRSRVDAFHGLFGGVIRRIVERRVKAEAPRVLQALRQRLQGGDPPANGVRDSGIKVAH
jgi:hypothetical protein